MASERLVEGHGGEHAVAVARADRRGHHVHAVGRTRSPMYDGAERLVDVRHEQTAVFAAEATAKLTRQPGLAVLTAGPASPTGWAAVFCLVVTSSR